MAAIKEKRLRRIFRVESIDVGRFHLVIKEFINHRQVGSFYYYKKARLGYNIYSMHLTNGEYLMLKLSVKLNETI